MKTKLLLFTGAVVLLLTSCIDELFIQGNGIPAVENRTVSDFSSVSSEGHFEVHIIQDEAPEVVIHAESNVMPFIKTTVNGGHLRIQTRGLHGIRNRLPIEVFIKAPTIESMVQSGSGWIKTGWLTGEAINYVVSGSGRIETSVEADNVDAVVSGSGELFISGIATDSHMAVSGSGEIEGWDFSTGRCEVKVSGSGDVWVHVDDYLKAVVSGSGHVFYSGTPFVDMAVSGSGGVIHKN